MIILPESTIGETRTPPHLTAALDQAPHAVQTRFGIEAGKVVKRGAGDRVGGVVPLHPGTIHHVDDRRRRYHPRQVFRRRRRLFPDDDGVNAKIVERKIKGRQQQENGGSEFAEVDADVTSEVSGSEQLLLRRREGHDVRVDRAAEQRKGQQRQNHDGNPQDLDDGLTEIEMQRWMGRGRRGMVEGNGGGLVGEWRGNGKVNGRESDKEESG